MDVSIPFIAGQWSLLMDADGQDPPKVMSQSPSLRGSGRFGPPGSPVVPCLAFQSPSLRGSGRFRRDRHLGRRGVRVSIPFIAGQWSLQAVFVSLSLAAGAFQSPSLRGSGRFFNNHCPNHVRRLCFNPLHCGAVVASPQPMWCPPDQRDVSIPFIAGQWSLRTPLPVTGKGV